MVSDELTFCINRAALTTDGKFECSRKSLVSKTLSPWLEHFNHWNFTSGNSSCIPFTNGKYVPKIHIFYHSTLKIIYQNWILQLGFKAPLSERGKTVIKEVMTKEMTIRALRTCLLPKRVSCQAHRAILADHYTVSIMMVTENEKEHRRWDGTMGKYIHGRYYLTKSFHYGRQKTVVEKEGSHIIFLSFSLLMYKMLEIHQPQSTWS